VARPVACPVACLVACPARDIDPGWHCGAALLPGL